MTSDDPPIFAGGPRLISVEEAARILQVAERDVWGWIAAGKIYSITLPGGGRRLRLLRETHKGSGPNQGGFISLQLHDADIDELTADEFQRELARARRAAQRARLLETSIPTRWQQRSHGHSGAWRPRSFASSRSLGWSGSRTRTATVPGATSRFWSAIVGYRQTSKPVGQRSARSKWRREMIAEQTTDPWPARAGHLPGGFPCPQAEIIGRLIRLYYGEASTPILALTAISLDEVRRRSR
jgi:hypothetical protein